MQEGKIPKQIFVTHICEHMLDAKLKYCIDLMRKLHPDWEVIFFSDGDARDFLLNEASDYLELYDWYPRPVMKSDLFRILVVYCRGGFYLDTDFLLYQALDPLRDYSAVFPWEREVPHKSFQIRYPSWIASHNERWSIGNYAFGAKAEHPFLKSILDELVDRSITFEAEHCNDLDILHSTGPDALTTVYYRDRQRWNDLCILKSDEMGLGSYGVHLIQGGWRKDGYQGE